MLRILKYFKEGNSFLVPLITCSVNYFIPITKIIVISQNLPEYLVCSICIIYLPSQIEVAMSLVNCILDSDNDRCLT